MSFNPSSQRPAYIEQLRAEARGMPYRPAQRNNRPEPARPTPEESRRLFTVADGNRWLELARREPEAKMLLGELWHQGELCMLFADTNIGKSILAVQIGESIARGQSITPFACQASPARVLYIDFELSKTQFGLRYSKGEEDHQFADNFFRAQYNFIPDPPPNVDENELLIAAIEYRLQQVKATVLIIDNITCLRGGTENSAVALSLMKSLKSLKNDHKLSILVLAHTPKRRNATQPISADDLHGSKLLVNFADSAFALGQSTIDTDLCYLKQIKQRNTRQRYGADNVCLCRIQKPGAFLHFKFEGYSAERHHLLSRTAASRREDAHKVATLAAAGHSQRDISNQLGIGLGTVNRMLQGCADVRMRGCADEEECVPHVRDEMRGFEDDEECVDMRMPGCADEEGFADALMANDLMTSDTYRDDQNGADEGSTDSKGFMEEPLRKNTVTEVAGKNTTSRATAKARAKRARERRAYRTLREKSYAAVENELTGCSPPPSKLVDSIQIVTPLIKFDPSWDRKTSTIDELLTPEIMDQILRKMWGENSIRGEGNDNCNQPNEPTNTKKE